MVRKDVDGVDQVLDEYPPFPFVGFGPDGADVDLGEQLRDLLEPCGEFAALRLGRVSFCFGLFEFVDLEGEPAFLLGEALGADLVGVVEIEELGPLGLECSDGGAAAGLGGGGGVALQLGTDGGLELVVLAEQVEPEQGCSVEAVSGASWHVAAGATVLAAVDGLSSVVVLDAEHP